MIAPREHTPFSRVHGHALIVFDGTCVMCNSFGRAVAWMDRREKILFATTQSELGKSLYDHYGLPSRQDETFLAIVNNEGYIKTDGMIAIVKELGYPWRILSVIQFIPRRIRNWLYDLLARNRYALFGRKDSCALPTEEFKKRVIS